MRSGFVWVDPSKDGRLVGVFFVVGFEEIPEPRAKPIDKDENREQRNGEHDRGVFDKIPRNCIRGRFCLRKNHNFALLGRCFHGVSFKKQVPVQSTTPTRYVNSYVLRII